MPNNPPETPAPAASAPPSPGASHEALFPPGAGELPVCSYNTCGCGRTWAPSLALSQCPGCQRQILVVKMENCPSCNEPVKRLTLRSDHLGPGGALMPVCRGAASLAEVTQIELERNHAAEEEAREKEIPHV